MTIVARTASVADYEALSRLFTADAHDCYCQFWHFRGDKNGWIETCALRPEENRDALKAELASDVAVGVVAYENAELVGWMRLGTRASLPKLLGQTVYRDLEPTGNVAVVGCLLVAEAARNKGVARALVSEGIAVAKAIGAHAIEGYPHKPTFRLSDHEAWRGPSELFASLGFTVVEHAERKNALAMFDAYPVMRLSL